MRALETGYAGCRFRSRLEARWAVFFDALNIEWQYEPQGFECSWRLMLDSATFPYLPDFWLPKLSLWAEVKGSWTDDERWRFLNAAASLSSNDGFGCHDAGGSDVLLLGPLPRLKEPEYFRGLEMTRVPYVLHMHKGTLLATAEDFTNFRHRCDGREVAGDNGDYCSENPWQTCLGDDQLLLGALDHPADEYMSALKVSRSARFEHGESGAIALG